MTLLCQYTCRLLAATDSGATGTFVSPLHLLRPKIIKSKLRNNVSLVMHEYFMFPRFRAHAAARIYVIRRATPRAKLFLAEHTVFLHCRRHNRIYAPHSRICWESRLHAVRPAFNYKSVVPRDETRRHFTVSG